MRDAPIILPYKRRNGQSRSRRKGEGARREAAHLQNVIVLHALRDGNLLRDRQRVREVLVRELMHLLGVICNEEKERRQRFRPPKRYRFDLERANTWG